MINTDSTQKYIYTSRTVFIYFYYFRTRSHNDELSKEITELKKSYTELKLLKESLESRETTIQENLTDTQKEAQLLKVCTWGCQACSHSWTVLEGYSVIYVFMNFSISYNMISLTEYHLAAWLRILNFISLKYQRVMIF